jgi:membrane fusion protein, multidrug efflux system
MNIRIPDTLESMPSTVNDLSERARKGFSRLSLRTRAILGVVGALVLALVLNSIFGGPAQRMAPPAPVIVTTVARQDIPVVEHTLGTVVSNATVQVTARVQGQLMKAFFTEGQTVHAGDLLFQVDSRPYRAAYDNAAAALTAAKAKAERYARLLAQKAIAPQEADDARAAYLEASANLESARLNLGYTQIHSPIDGKTGPILIQPGNLITATGSSSSSGGGTTTNAASTLVVITQISPIKVSFALPQADLPRIQKRLAKGMPVRLTQQGESDGKTITATVDFVGNQVNAQAGTIELRASVPNTDGTLVPGQLVDVAVELDAVKGALTVPHDAINLGPESSFVYLVKQGKAVMATVTVIHDDGTTAAITGDVKEGDTVVVDGQLKVEPGGPVRIAGHTKS